MDKRGSREGHLKKGNYVESQVRILCEGGAGANGAKVDQTTEMYFLLSDAFI